MKKSTGIVAAAVAATVTVIAFLTNTTTKTIQVPCLIPKYDTTQASVKVKDSEKVSYTWYDTTYRHRWHRASKMIITTHFADSFHYTYRDSSYQVIADNSYMGLCDFLVTDTIKNEPPPTKTQFGVLVNDAILTTAQKVQLAQLYNVPYIRTEIRLFDFDGVADNIQKYHDAGFKIIANCNWENNNPASPRKFVRDTAAYIVKLDMVFSKYGSMIELAVIENEILTLNYFNDDMANYITMLKIAIREGRKYGVAVTNSGDHLEYINAILSGSKKLTTSTVNCKYLMEHYRGLGLAVINTHSGKLFTDSSTTDAQMKAIANYIRSTTGVDELISNETVLQAQTSNYVNKIVRLYNLTNFTKVIFFDGVGSGDLGAQSMHVTGKVAISPLGTIFKQAIQ